MSKRIAIYLRVSTAGQTTCNQRLELEAWAKARGYDISGVYEDHGISGAKGRDKRPEFDRLLKDSARRRFDVIAAWSVDRLGRSLQHLVETLNELNATGVDLYLHQQALDTTTPSGRAMFGMLSVFSQFEREMIVERVRSGMARAKSKGTRSGRAIGRPKVSGRAADGARAGLLAGQSVRETANAAKLSVGKVAAIRRALVVSGALAA
jgi:DNA invertase Pin-like site-specific DNA recombinase